MGSGLHLNDRGDAVLLDPGDHTGEPVTGGLRDDGSIGLASLRLQPPHILEAHEALTASRPADAETAGGLPASQRVDGDADELGRLADT